MKVGLMFVLVLTMVSSVAAQGKVTIPSNTFGCVWPVMEKVRDYARVGDSVAIERLWTLGVVRGECATFDRGESVFVIERSVWQNMTRVKKPGALQDFWIPGLP
jgi:hypothetical protein